MARGSTCGEALVRLLQDYGVDTVFGIPGVHTLELYRGLAGNAVRHVQPRHEQGAGFMADGYARASGKPGVCFLITGPGVTNAATAMGQAYSNSVPMLVISSVNARRDLGKGWGRLHEITDQRASTAPLTAFSATALSPADVPDLLARAFDVFQSSRPRPVHIEIPIDVFPLEVTEAWRAAVAAQRPSPPAESLDQAATLLAGAKRPAIVAGGGAIEAGEARLSPVSPRCSAPPWQPRLRARASFPTPIRSAWGRPCPRRSPKTIWPRPTSSWRSARNWRKRISGAATCRCPAS
jgi:thiamine pyrophosphate-dependent acetolactate synthase large subunit-like protein